MRRTKERICGMCGWWGESGLPVCQECGSSSLIRVCPGAVVSFPPQTLPCPRCGSVEREVVFRGWARVVAIIIWARESRAAAYLCTECARTETTKYLALNGLFGWWQSVARRSSTSPTAPTGSGYRYARRPSSPTQSRAMTDRRRGAARRRAASRNQNRS
jgi:hypothetical protein